MPRGKLPAENIKTLEMALVGYELEKQRIDEKIREVRGALGVNGGPAASGMEPKKRRLSAAARRRIAAAQKKRWAEHRKAHPAKSK